MFNTSQENQMHNAFTNLSLLSPEKQKQKYQTSQHWNIYTPGRCDTITQHSPYVVKHSCYTNSSWKTVNYFTEKKTQISSNKIYCPSPNTVKTDRRSDRFIPMNKGVNLIEQFDLTVNHEESNENVNMMNKSPKQGKVNEKVVYKSWLKKQLFGDDTVTSTTTYSRPETSLKIKSKLTWCNSEIKSKERFLSEIQEKTPENLYENKSDEIRKIHGTPYKILKVDNLMDDFYVNLWDWSSRNDVAVGLGKSVGLWSTNQTRENTWFTYQDEKYVSSVMWSQNGETLAVGNTNGEVELYDIETKKLVHVLGGHQDRIGVIAWNNNNMISTGSKDCTIITRDIRTPGTNHVMKHLGHSQEVCGLKWSFDNAQLASGGNDNKWMLWTLHSAKPIMDSSSHRAAVKAIAWSPHQNNWLASGGGTADQSIQFWNTSTWTQTHKEKTGSQVCNLVFSKTVNELVSTHGFSLNQIIVWDYPSMKKITTWTGHKYRVWYLGISPDGQNIVTGAGDETWRFWKLFPPYKNSNSSGLMSLMSMAIR